MALIRFGWACAVAFMSGVCFYATLRVGSRRRQWLWLLLLESLAVSTPLLVPARARFLRFLAAVIAAWVGTKLYDLHRAAGRGFRPHLGTFVGYLPNPFALALDTVLREPRPPWRPDVLRLLLGALGSAVALALLIRIFRVDWQRLPFALEHCAKLVGLFLVILFFANGMAAGYRLCGLPATNFSGNYFFARTPAEFWRQYNRPVAQFFYEDVFKPLGGMRRPMIATLMTFAVSGVIHEYIFDIPARRVVGWQMAFFIVQGLAVVATLRVRPRGWRAALAILLTLAFNVATGVLFFKSMNAVVPFYVNRVPG